MTSIAPAVPFATMFAKPEEVGSPDAIFIFGEPGTFKSTIAGGIVKVPQFHGKRVLYIDVDGSATVLANDPEIYAAMEADLLNILPIDKLDPNAYGKLQYFLGGYDEEGNFQQGEAFKYDYDVVVLDSLDVAQEIAVEWLQAHTLNEKGTAKDTRKAWGLVSQWTSNIAWALKNSEPLGIMVGHSVEQAEDSGAIRIKPKLSGSAKDNIAAIPDLVAYVAFEANPEDKNDVRLVATIGASDGIIAKNRWRLPTKLVDFDLPTFFTAINARKTASAPAEKVA